MLFRVLPRELIERQNEVEMTLYLKSGSIIVLKGADEPDSLRGAGPYGIVFDEFATMKYEAWGITEPIVRANGGWAWFIGTPKGKNHLYQMHIRGGGEDVEWKSFLLKASTSGIIAPTELENMRKPPHGMPEPLYNQEMECEFLEGEGTVFRNVKVCATAQAQAPITGHSYSIGVDLAKVQDWTVLAVYDRSNNQQVYQDRFQRIEWPFQKARIRAIAKHYNNGVVTLDATGIGDPIADDLARDGIAVEPYKLTEQSKKDIIEKFSIAIDQRGISYLPVDDTITELENFSYEMGPTGKIRYQARTGFHDDIVIAHALAVWPLVLRGYRIPEPVKTPVQLLYEQKVKQLTREDEGDSDEWSDWYAE